MACVGRSGIILFRKDNVLCWPRAVDRFVETLVVFFRCHRSDLCFQMSQVGLAVLSDVTDPTWRVFRCHRSDLACFSVVIGLSWRVFRFHRSHLTCLSYVTGLTCRIFRCHRSDLTWFQMSQVWLALFSAVTDLTCRVFRCPWTAGETGRAATQRTGRRTPTSPMDVSPRKTDVTLLQRYCQDFLWTLHTVNTPQEMLPPGLFMDFTHGQYSSRNVIAMTFYGLYTRSILLKKRYHQVYGLYTRSMLLKKRYHQDSLRPLHTGNAQETLPPGLLMDFTHGQCFSGITTTKRTPYGFYTQTMLLAHKSTLTWQ